MAEFEDQLGRVVDRAQLIGFIQSLPDDADIAILAHYGDGGRHWLGARSTQQTRTERLVYIVEAIKQKWLDNVLD